VLVGEPTSNTFVAGHKGIFKARLVAKGVAGHSSQDVGPSAVHELVGCCARLVRDAWGEHPLLGRGTLNVGQISGGVAPNVVADHAEAEVLVRTVEAPQVVEGRLRGHLGEHVSLDRTAKAYAPVEFHVPEGEVGVPAAFGTDAPHMPRWGRPLLFGCGSILDAHTDHERVAKSDLLACVERHVRTARELLTTVRERA
jgi:acetylornithine deacetylase